MQIYLSKYFLYQPWAVFIVWSWQMLSVARFPRNWACKEAGPGGLDIFPGIDEGGSTMMELNGWSNNKSVNEVVHIEQCTWTLYAYVNH